MQACFFAWNESHIEDNNNKTDVKNITFMIQGRIHSQKPVSKEGKASILNGNSVSATEWMWDSSSSAIPVVLENAVHPHRRSQAPVSLEYYPNTKM